LDRGQIAGFGAISRQHRFPGSTAFGCFQRDKQGKLMRPGPAEVRVITERETERMIEMDDDELRSAVTKYADDFGSKAAEQLERYVRRQQRSR
jgi:hypothetical protein